METDTSPTSEDTVVQIASSQSESKATGSLSSTDNETVPSLEKRLSSNDSSTISVNPQYLQVSEGHVQHTGLSQIKSEHKTVGDGGTEHGVPLQRVDVVEPNENSHASLEDKIGGGALLWCQVTKRNHGELVEWGISKCPACKQECKQEIQGPRQGPRPQTIQQLSETQASDKPVPRSQIQYSNKFLWNNGAFPFWERWPDLLDLDRDRGKFAMSQGPTDEPVLEIVSVVTTNLAPTPGVRYSSNWIISNMSLVPDQVSKEVIIRSRRVMHVFRTLVTYYPNLNLRDAFLTISHPYALFHQYFEQIEEFQDTFHHSKEENSGMEHPNRALNRAQLKICDEETYKHLNTVREVIEGENGGDVREEIERHHQSPAVATYSMLWLLFKPGTKVYVRRLGSPVSVGVVLSVQGGELSLEKSDPFSIDYWTLEFDGTRLGRCPNDFVFKPFAGEKNISELEVTPCSYYDAEDAGNLRDALIDRGLKYWRFLPGFQVDYRGKLPKEQREWQGRVMIDPRAYYRYAYNIPDHRISSRDQALALPTVGNIQDSGSETQTAKRAPNRPMPGGLSPSQARPMDRNIQTDVNQKWQIPGPPRNENGPWAEYDNLIPGPEMPNLELIDKLTGERDMSRYLLCPPNVIGLDLKSRQWQLFDVSCCHDTVFNHGAIDSLVMKEEIKSVIKSLVHRYTAVDCTAGGAHAPKPWTADFIKNKGEGQIFLLHGSPGVGKTYTAECIAEATRRPLLSLTCGDIGTDEVMAERTLSKWFRLAENWGAVMLLDEADVFLEKRSMSDLQRNSLVSVFLRIVEYYRGILFLTTNRVGQFDDAFINRIHTVIRYENFSNDKQNTIWAQFFKKLEKERRKDMRIGLSARKYVRENEDLRKIEWNGRQIRNAFQTAVAFAEYRFLQLSPEEREGEDGKATLEDQDFAKVCEMIIAFHEYMNSIHGGDEARRARMERIRDDSFKEISSFL